MKRQERKEKNVRTDGLSETMYWCRARSDEFQGLALQTTEECMFDSKSDAIDREYILNA